MPENEIQHAAPVPPFVTFVTSAVPMVFDNSMSYYEALCALWKWLQDDVIDVINNNANVTDQYIEYDLHTRELFTELETYVNTYFDNLDVQEEINNKLDAMAEAGTLGQLLGQYVQPLLDALQPEINFTPSFYKFGGFEGVMSQQRLSTFTGDTCEINEVLDISDYDVADQFKTIANVRFILNSDMITWTNSFRSLPTFVNCVFWGNGNSIVADNLYIATAKFINCVFYNCALIQDATYVQSSRFIGCRFAGTTDFITAANCGDIVFDNCQGESDFKARLLNVDASDSDNKNAVDHLRLINCIFESNDTTELVKFNYNATVDVDGCYVEAYPEGIINATAGASNSTLIMNISNTKTWNAGNTIFKVDSSYDGVQASGGTLKTAVTFKSCRFGSSSSTNLMNRYDFMKYSINDCELENVEAPTLTSVDALTFKFTDVSGTLTYTNQLLPGHLYIAMQSRATYTGFVMYAIMTSDTTIAYEKLFDTNNRWTITDQGSLSIKITTGGYGEGRLIDMGRVSYN